MCVAILKKPEGVLTTAVLRACFEHNQDGAGFAYVDEAGKLCVNKGYFDFEQFLDVYRPIEERVGGLGPMMVHFRISTGGTKTADNCHPFIFPGGAFMHNGFFFAPPADKSDTNMLVERIGPNLTYASVALHKKAIEAAFTASNKAVTLYPDRSYHIINENAGQWIDHVWFSNVYWRSRMTMGGVMQRRADGMRVPHGACTPLTAAEAAWQGRRGGFHD